MELSQSLISAALILSSIGVISVRKPIHASLFFLLTLLMLAALYLQLSAQFIATMQILVYAGAILVLFVFVMVLFQDAHKQLSELQPQSSPTLLWSAASFFSLMLILFGKLLIDHTPMTKNLPENFGTVQTLGKALYIDFFFPFEAASILFLVAVVGALYIGKKEH
jgi:NADH-quinone oxidoreductase subunit J